MEPLADDPLGPFQPPARYRYEEELRAPMPRCVPYDFHHSIQESTQRNAVWTSATLGVLLVLASLLRFIHMLAEFFTPFAYLAWTGAFFLAWAGFQQITRLTATISHRYFAHGTPFVARIRTIKQRTHETYPTKPYAYFFTAHIDYRDPQTGNLVSAKVDSIPIGVRDFADYELRFAPGDYVTALALRRMPPQLYGFLGINPHLGIAFRDGSTPREPWLRPVLAVLKWFAVVAVVALILASFRCSPFGATNEPSKAGLCGAVLIGVPVWLWRCRATLRSSAGVERSAYLKRAKSVFVYELFLMFPVVLWAGIGCGCGSVVLNAILDFAAPPWVVVAVTGFQEGGDMIPLRNRRVLFRLPNDLASSWFCTQAERATLSRPLALAEVQPGAFGWRWVRAVRPFPAATLAAAWAAHP